MKSYRQKGPTVQAIQWWPGVEVAGLQYPLPEKLDNYPNSHPPTGEVGVLETHCGVYYVVPGSWIVYQDKKLPHIVFKNEKFDELYEELDAIFQDAPIAYHKLVPAKEQIKL